MRALWHFVLQSSRWTARWVKKETVCIQTEKRDLSAGKKIQVVFVCEGSTSAAEVRGTFVKTHFNASCR